MTAWIQSFAAFIVVFLTGWTLRSSNKAPEVMIRIDKRSNVRIKFVRAIRAIEWVPRPSIPHCGQRRD